LQLLERSNIDLHAETQIVSGMFDALRAAIEGSRASDVALRERRRRTSFVRGSHELPCRKKCHIERHHDQDDAERPASDLAQARPGGDPLLLLKSEYSSDKRSRHDERKEHEALVCDVHD
jgi:hypothetical protein